MATPATYPNRFDQSEKKLASETVTGNGAINWIKLKPAKKYEWGSGANLVGILTAALATTVRDSRTGQPKPAMRYTVREMEGESVFFFGTVQLDEMLSPQHVGNFVSITCTGENKQAGRNGNPMKLFEVMISEHKAPGWAGDGTPITDEDLPAQEFFAS